MGRNSEKPLVEKIRFHLEVQIIAGRLKPRQRLVEEEIAREMSVSRSLIREFFRLMQEARYSVDQKKRQQNYYRATEIFADELPWIPVFQDVATLGVSAKVKNFKSRPDWLVLPQRLGL